MNKHKKRVLWVVLFFFLTSINLFITTMYVRKVQRIQVAARILDEIETGLGPLDQNQVAKEPSALLKGEARTGDARVANLKRFFRKYNSPLFDSAEYIVEVADKYSFDYRLLPAIAMQESGLCRVIPHNSHNCWGWGIYGNTITRFDSYEDAIDAVSKGLRTHYLDKGLVTASQIMEKYTPSSNGSWAYGVNTFLKALE